MVGDRAEVAEDAVRDGLVVGGGERLDQRVVKFGQRLRVELAGAEIDHGFDRGDDAVPARLGEQRAVIAAALIVERARQVDHLRARAAEKIGARQVVLGGDDLVRRVGVREVARRVDEDDPVGHG